MAENDPYVSKRSIQNTPYKYVIHASPQQITMLVVVLVTEHYFGVLEVGRKRVLCVSEDAMMLLRELELVP